MARSAINELPDRAMRALSHVGTTVVVATVDASGWPDTAPIAWVIARDKRTIRMAVNADATTLQDIKDTAKTSLFLIKDNLALAIRGHASVLKEPMRSVPFPTAMVEVLVESVVDKSSLPVGTATGQTQPWNQRRSLVSDVEVEKELAG